MAERANSPSNLEGDSVDHETLKIAFFNAISGKWDGWENLVELNDKLDRGLQRMGVTAGEVIVDVGCGTGNLTLALLRTLGANGQVVAIDISRQMIERAKGKVSDPRARFLVQSAEDLALDNSQVDRVICFSVWPHFDDATKAIQQFWRVLKPHGMLHVWHLISRERVNQIHADAGPAVCFDMLPPAVELARDLEKAGFEVQTMIDDAEQYLVSARKLKLEQAMPR